MRIHVAFTPATPRGSRRGATIGTMEQVTLTAGEEPPFAAHLVTPRRGYIHHGLYVGNGRIIHYPGLVRGLRRRAVEEVSLEEFARGRPVAVRMDSQPRFAGVEAVRRARSRLGENRYHIIRNNCEHFCEWCVHGRNRSLQIEQWLERPRRMLLATLRFLAPGGRPAAGIAK